MFPNLFRFMQQPERGIDLPPLNQAKGGVSLVARARGAMAQTHRRSSNRLPSASQFPPRCRSASPHSGDGPFDRLFCCTARHQAVVRWVPTIPQSTGNLKSGHGCGHGSVTVLGTVLNLPQSHSITTPQHLTRWKAARMSHSITLNHHRSHSP